jgi:hypothetical protein
MTATVITETNTYPATISAPVPGDAADADTLTTVALQPIVNRTYYLKSRQDLIGLYIPGSGIVNVPGQSIGYTTTGGPTALLDTSTDPVRITGGLTVLAGDIVFGDVFFKVTLATSASVYLWVECGVAAEQKLNAQQVTAPTLSGGITGSGFITEVHFPIYYPVQTTGTFLLAPLVQLTGTASVGNLYSDNTDWAHLQIWRPLA